MALEAKTKCLVVGAGPVGALAALYAAQQGWEVQVCELRGERGINALRHSGSADLVQNVLKETIPMVGRMIHGADRNDALFEQSQQYDVHGRYIRAVDRSRLNKLLLDELENLPNVRLMFEHKMTGADFRRRKAWFEQRQSSDQISTVPLMEASMLSDRAKEIEVAFDIILGCDGAHSSVRYHMMKFVQMNYEQNYIDVLWCEFVMPPRLDGVQTSPSAKDGFVTSPNHLHIWPAEDSMFIAIPNKDKSFTCTLFAPSSEFTILESNPEKIEEFFRSRFAGALELVGEAAVRGQFENNPHLPLISIKCSPHHFGSTGVIMGDAAHAMVPFYGQGMNAGLEDVRVLFSHLSAHPDTNEGRTDALLAYSRERVPDAHTINDLAFANYWEMHEGVRSPMYLLRKKIEEALSDKVPFMGFATQYRRISFTNERYSQVARVVKRQKQVLLASMLGSIILPLLGMGFWWLRQWPNANSHLGGFGYPRVVRRFLKILWKFE